MRHRHFLVMTLVVLALGLPALIVLAGEGDDGERRRIRVCPRIILGDSDGHPLRHYQQRAFLGVEATQLTPELRRHFGVADDTGVLLGRIVEDSPAHRAGLEVGDVVTAVADEPVDSPWALGSAVRRHRGGDLVRVDYFRDGRSYSATVEVEETERCAYEIGGLFETLEGLEGLKELRHLRVPLDLSALKELENLKLDGLHKLDFDFPEEAFEEAMRSMRDAFESEEWQERMESLRELNLEEMERHMERLQRRMEELERRLERELEEAEENAEMLLRGSREGMQLVL